MTPRLREQRSFSVPATRALQNFVILFQELHVETLAETWHYLTLRYINN